MKVAMFHRTFAHALYAREIEGLECQLTTEDALFAGEAAENTTTWIHWELSVGADTAEDLVGRPHPRSLGSDAWIPTSVTVIDTEARRTLVLNSLADCSNGHTVNTPFGLRQLAGTREVIHLDIGRDCEIA